MKLETIEKVVEIILFCIGCAAFGVLLMASFLIMGFGFMKVFC